MRASRTLKSPHLSSGGLEVGIEEPYQRSRPNSAHPSPFRLIDPLFQPDDRAIRLLEPLSPAAPVK